MPEVCTEFIPVEEGSPDPGDYLCRVKTKDGIRYLVLLVPDCHSTGFFDDEWNEYEVTHYAKVPMVEDEEPF